MHRIARKSQEIRVDQSRDKYRISGRADIRGTITTNRILVKAGGENLGRTE